MADALFSCELSSTELTDAQIQEIQTVLGAALRRANLDASNVQIILERYGHLLEERLAAKLVGVVEELSSEFSHTIVRRIDEVIRSRAPRAMIEATGRTLYVDKNVVATIPSARGSHAEVIFFKMGRHVSDEEVDREYEKRGLVRDVYALAAVNEQDPSFADEHPNGTNWKDAKGRWCFMDFRRVGETRYICARRFAIDWGADMWFGGVRRKTSAQKSGKPNGNLAHSA